MEFSKEFFLSLLRGETELTGKLENFDLYLLHHVLPLSTNGLESLARQIEAFMADTPDVDAEMRSRFNPINWLGEYLMRHHPRYATKQERAMYKKFDQWISVEHAKREFLKRREDALYIFKSCETELKRIAERQDLPYILSRLGDSWYLGSVFVDNISGEALDSAVDDIGCVSFSRFWQMLIKWFESQTIITVDTFAEAAIRRAEAEKAMVAAEFSRKLLFEERTHRGTDERLSRQNARKERALRDPILRDILVGVKVMKAMDRGGDIPTTGEHIDIIVGQLEDLDCFAELPDKRVWNKDAQLAMIEFQRRLDKLSIGDVDAYTLTRLLNCEAEAKQLQKDAQARVDAAGEERKKQEADEEKKKAKLAADARKRVEEEKKVEEMRRKKTEEEKVAAKLQKRDNAFTLVREMSFSGNARGSLTNYGNKLIRLILDNTDVSSVQISLLNDDGKLETIAASPNDMAVSLGKVWGPNDGPSVSFEVISSRSSAYIPNVSESDRVRFLGQRAAGAAFFVPVTDSAGHVYGVISADTCAKARQGFDTAGYQISSEDQEFIDSFSQKIATTLQDVDLQRKLRVVAQTAVNAMIAKTKAKHAFFAFVDPHTQRPDGKIDSSACVAAVGSYSTYAQKIDSDKNPGQLTGQLLPDPSSTFPIHDENGTLLAVVGVLLDEPRREEDVAKCADIADRVNVAVKELRKDKRGVKHRCVLEAQNINEDARLRLLLGSIVLQQLRGHVENLDTKTWAELKSYTNPPPIIIKVMQAVGVVLNYAPKDLDTWAKIRVLIGPPLVSKLVAFDPTTVMKKLKWQRASKIMKGIVKEAVMEKGSLPALQLFHWYEVASELRQDAVDARRQAQLTAEEEDAGDEELEDTQ
eukprot:GILJ01001985.1.p1 GENE.GILJ01001985.1~~GILJ01001985.1.p1  ORF type:complete len:869 (-),score=162.42 GILJ01001985.1:205-2811(-)